MSPRLLLVGLLLLACAGARAADVPTKEEWLPVESALASNDGNPEAMLQDLVQRYPKWIDGIYELSRLQLKTSQYEPALASATLALKLSPLHCNAAAIAEQALIQLDRFADAMRIADGFVGSKDTKSAWVHFHAANAAYQVHDFDKADAYLKRAKDRAVAAPWSFHFLDGRLAVHANPSDLPRAEASFSRALVADDKCWDAWYECGRVQMAMGQEKGAKGDEYLRKAQESFEHVTKALPNDFESWLGMGQAQLGRGKIAQETEDDEKAAQFLHLAESSLKEALLLNDAQATAHVCLGETLLRENKAEPAIDHFKRAIELGVRDRDVDFNLAIALEKAGRNAEAEEIFKSTEAISPSEKIATAMNHYNARRFELAERLLAMTLGSTDVSGDAERHAAVLRFIGHSWRHWGEQFDKLLGKSSSDALMVERDRCWDAAAKAYHEAGDLGDVAARDHYLALQARRDPKQAYLAGWTHLDWNGYRSVGGWGVVIGNYGGSHAWEDQTHYVIWGVVAGSLFLLWLQSLFRKRRPHTTRIYPNANKPLPTPTNLVPKTTHAERLAPASTTKKIKQALEPKKYPTPDPGVQERQQRDADRTAERAETRLADQPPRRPRR